MNAREFNVKRWAILYARIALGAAFLSGIADRFGLWGNTIGYGDFAHFVQYTAQVNSFMPAFTIPFLAWAATVAELVLGIALISGVWLRRVALGSALLLVLFGTAMAISYAVFCLKKKKITSISVLSKVSRPVSNLKSTT